MCDKIKMFYAFVNIREPHDNNDCFYHTSHRNIVESANYFRKLISIK